jgi:hypothetical protein
MSTQQKSGCRSAAAGDLHYIGMALVAHHGV